jgi:threonine/homoserine/homoserine lactone efflux protein
LFQFALSSLLLGIAFCAPPGVITAEAVRRGTKAGFSPAFRVELGSVAGDAVWAVIALTGGAILVQHRVTQLSLGLVGTFFLFYLSYQSLRDVLLARVPASNRDDSSGGFLTGMLLSLGNPFGIAFWLSVGSTAVSSRITHPQLVHYFVFFFTFMLGALAWCFFLAGLVAWGKRYINLPFIRWVNLACGLFLAGFGLQLSWSSLQMLLQLR